MDRARSPRRIRGLVSRRAGLVASLTGAATFALAAGPLASAVGAASSSSNPLSSVESQLTTLENPPSGNITLTEAGSSLFGPLFQEWQKGYPASNVSIEPTISSSGKGVSAVQANQVNIGASDPYLPPVDLSNEGLLNIPMVVSAQQVNYNIPGLKQSTHLRLTGTVIDDIYTGSITNWDSTQITKLNPGVKIPSTPIVTLHRADSSGDSFLFSSFLGDADSSSFVNTTGGPSNTPAWPTVPGALAETGNSGMLTTCQATPGCIAYIGISYLNNAIAGGLGYALLENHAGQFVGPLKANIADEVSAFQKIPANGAISLVYASAKSARLGYPIVNFEYAVVYQSQSSSTTAQAIKAFLAWGMDPRNGASSKYLPDVQFQPLPTNALKVAVTLLNSIT